MVDNKNRCRLGNNKNRYVLEILFSSLFIEKRSCIAVVSDVCERKLLLYLHQ